jgi:hypothetical protein
VDQVDDLPIVHEGTWLYDGKVSLRVRILSSPNTWGTGDCGDEAEVAEDQPIPCFFLAYEAAGSPGSFCNIFPNLVMSLDEAIRFAEAKFPGIRWVESAAR